jgi:hypothetical protein
MLNVKFYRLHADVQNSVCVDVRLGTARQECGYLSRVRMRLDARGAGSRSTILRTIKPDSALKAIFPVASLDMLKMAGYVSKHLS